MKRGNVLSIIQELHKRFFTYDQALKAHEDWSERTKKAPGFKKLISIQSKFELALRKHWKQTAENADQFVNWASYAAENVKTAATKDVTVTDDAGNSVVLPIGSMAFVSEKQLLLAILQAYVLQGIAVGVDDAQTMYVDAGLSASSAAVQEAALERSSTLVTNITETTRNNIQQSIATSLKLGETVSDAQTRLSDIIDSPYRATLIARTETRNSYVDGQNQVADATGATTKEWDPSSDPCELCLDNVDDGEIPIDQDFTNGDEPHPNCLCGAPIYNYANSSSDDSSDDSEDDQVRQYLLTIKKDVEPRNPIDITNIQYNNKLHENAIFWSRR